MSIRRRILLGHLIVALLLAVPALYALYVLRDVTGRTQESLSIGVERLSALKSLNSALEEALKAQGTLDTDVGLGKATPATYAAVTEAVDKLQTAHERAKPTVEAEGGSGEAEFLAATVMRWTESSGAPKEGRDRDESADPDEAPGDPAGGSLTRIEQTGMARWLVLDLFQRAVSTLGEEAREAERQAAGAAQLSLLGLSVAALLAILSSFVTVRWMREPIRRLMQSTTAVSAGKFGIAVPPMGGGDDLARLTAAFNEMSRNLAHVERMKADFLSIAAHELRTPLTCIKGYVGALRVALPEEARADPDIVRFLDRIDREAGLIADQVSDLLTFGMIEAGQLRLEHEEIPTEGFLVMVAEAFRPIAAERQIDFQLRIDSPPRSIVADQKRLNQVVMNLLDNAHKYTPSGGKVTLSAGTKAGRLTIEVHDTCPGIPKDQLDLIFEKYARVRTAEATKQKGTGLGLAVARGIVVAHGGSIEAASEPGQGCRFTVTLPAGDLGARSSRRTAVA